MPTDCLKCKNYYSKYTLEGSCKDCLVPEARESDPLCNFIQDFNIRQVSKQEKDVFSSQTFEVYLENPTKFEDSLSLLSVDTMEEYFSLEIEELITPDDYELKWNILTTNGKTKIFINLNFTKEVESVKMSLTP